jgi:hypothetical protein
VFFCDVIRVRQYCSWEMVLSQKWKDKLLNTGPSKQTTLTKEEFAESTILLDLVVLLSSPSPYHTINFKKNQKF